MMVSQRVQHEKKIILLLIIANLIVFGLFFCFRLMQTNDTAQKDLFLNQIRLGASPQTIGIYDAQESYVLTKTADGWICDADPDLSISRVAVNFMKTALLELEPQRVIENGTEYFDEFGLNQPSAVITVGCAEGEKIYHIGNFNPVLDAYYVTVDESDCIFVISSDDIKLIRRNLLSLVEDPRITEDFTDYVELIHVDGRNMSYEIRRNGKGYTVETGGDRFSCSEFVVTNICSALSSASYQCKYRDASEEDKEYCGFTDPEFTFHFEDGKDKKLDLTIGKGKDDCYYLNENDSKVIYQIGTSSIERLSERLHRENME